MKQFLIILIGAIIYSIIRNYLQIDDVIKSAMIYGLGFTAGLICETLDKEK